MSRKTRLKKRSTIQSLEQLILMSASELDIEVLSAADVQDVATGTMPDFEQLILEDTALAERPELPLLEGLPVDAEFVFPTMLMDEDLAASTGMVTSTGLPVGEEGEVLPFDDIVFLETADGEFIEVGPGELMEFASFEDGFDPASATGVVEIGDLPIMEDGTTPVFNDLVLFETPDGDIIEVRPEELIGFLPEDGEFDPAAATGIVEIDDLPWMEDGTTPVFNDLVLFETPDGDIIEIRPEDLVDFIPVVDEFDPASATGIVEPGDLPTDGIPPEEPLIFEGPNGELIQLAPGEELPEFLNMVPEFNPIAASGAAGSGVGGVQVSPDGEIEFEFSETEFDTQDGLLIPQLEMTAGGSDAVDILQFADGQAGTLSELSDFDLASASGVADGDGDVSLPDVAEAEITSGQNSDGEDDELLEFLNMADSTDVSAQIQGSDVTSDANSIDLPQNADTSDDSLIYASAADATGGAAAISIQGTEAGEWISGTVADDVIDAGAGNDEIHVSVGDNIVDGGAGEDTLVVYEGAQADYTITQQADGTTIFEGPGLNGETVRVELTNVEQILFNDGIVRLADLDTGGGSTSGSTVTGTDAGEWIVGTDQDDDIVAGAGDDEIYAPLGTNTINGGEGVDTLVVYEGNRADFVLSNIGNGTIYLEGPGLNGKVVRSELTNVEVILFNDGAVLTSSVQDLVA